MKKKIFPTLLGFTHYGEADRTVEPILSVHFSHFKRSGDEEKYTGKIGSSSSLRRNVETRDSSEKETGNQGRDFRLITLLQYI